MKISEMNDTEKVLFTLESLRRQRDNLLRAAKLALPGLVHLEAETSFAGIRADAQMAVNTLRSAIAEAEKT